MSGRFAGAALLALVAAPLPALAQDGAAAPRHAVGADVSFSTDADDTEVLRLGLNGDWHYRGPEEYRGFRLERVWFRPAGGERRTDERVYFRIADAVRGWKFNAAIGTDGETVLGQATIHNEARVRQEYFLERDKVETQLGVTRGIYYTFGGAAIDLPFDDRTQLTLVGGLQEFTGDNLRTHLRANLIHSLKPSWGLSAQLRTRYFRNSDPREFDYYSPRHYAEVLPVLQIRRFSDGWRYLAAAGLGAQRDSGSGWRQSRYLNLRATSPTGRKGWAVAGDLLYNSTPVTNADSYHYLRVNFGLTRAF